MAIGASELDERLWALRAAFVLISPRTVFGAMRDADDVANARQEIVSALVLVAGIAAVLSAPQTGRLLDDPAVDGLLVAVLVLLTGFIYGSAGYWIAGALVRLGERLLGGGGSYRRARHIVAFAAAPLALSLLVLWPLRIALHGADLFRTGGDDGGAAGELLARLALVSVPWSLVLVIVGLRAVHGWSWPRAVASSLPVVAAVAIVAAAALRLG